MLRTTLRSRSRVSVSHLGVLDLGASAKCLLIVGDVGDSEGAGKQSDVVDVVGRDLGLVLGLNGGQALALAALSLPVTMV